jgi:hypothetical protein
VTFTVLAVYPLGTKKIRPVGDRLMQIRILKYELILTIKE